MKRVLIITGPGGDAQGWGNLEVTKTLSGALNSDGKSSEIAFVNTMDDFLKAIDTHAYDIIWSALYYISEKEDIIGSTKQLLTVFSAHTIFPYPSTTR